MSAAVIAFPKEANQSTFDEAWSLLPSTMKTRSLSRDKLRPLWANHARKVGGQDVLLGALRAYLKSDKDFPKSGGPGLQVWMNQGKYDHWLEAGNSVVQTPEKSGGLRPSFPEPFRSALIRSCGEGFVVSYVDQCTLDGTVLVVPKGKLTAASRIREKAREMKASGLTAMRVEK